MTTGKRLPYPGLRAFHRDESDLFFGREGHVDKMVDRLTETRFLAVLGPSGGGKSSLVKTGLLDALDLGYSKAGTAWCVAYMKPGGAPIRNLAAGLLAAASVPAAPVDIDMLAALLRRGPRSIGEWAGNGNLPRGSSLLILADQFEELFRYGDYAGREEAEAFVKLLLEAARTPGLPLYVCITMRSEFLGACSMIPGLAEAINDGLYLTPRLSREQCAEAIVGPAGVCGFDVEPDLVNKILNDMAAMAPWSDDAEDNPQRRLSQRADQLPLMQHVLNRMWLAAASGSGRPQLTRKEYEALGGLTGALDIHGEEILAELGPNGRHTAESVFRALTTGATLENAVRRPCPFRQLVAEVHGTREEVLATVEAFRAPAANFLQPPHSVALADDTPIDISHESLIRQWSTLSRWFTAEAQSAATWKDLLASTERYEGGRKDLLSGLDLAQASAWWEQDKPSREWAQRHGGDYDGVRDFLRQSEAERDRERISAEERGWRERRRLKFQLVAAVAALAIVAGLGIATAVYWLKARSSQNTALARSVELERNQRELVRQTEIARQKTRVATMTAEQARLAQREAVIQRGAAVAAAEDARDASEAASQSAAQARRNAAAALAAQETLRRQIDSIGDIVAGSNSSSSFNISSSDLRDQITTTLCEREAAPPTCRQKFAARGTNIPSTTDIRQQIAGVLTESLSNLDVSDHEQLANFMRLYAVNERAGNMTQAARALASAWEISERILRPGGWAGLSEADKVLVFEAGYEMAWHGRDLNMTDRGNRAHQKLREIGVLFEPSSPQVSANPRLAIGLANYENLESAFYREWTYPIDLSEADRHSRRSLRYAELAEESTRQQGDVALHTLARERHAAFARNFGLGFRGPQFVEAMERACVLARAFYADYPGDERAIEKMAICAEEIARINPLNIAPLQEIETITTSALTVDPGNQLVRNLRTQVVSRALMNLTRRDRCEEEDCERLRRIWEEDVDRLLTMGFVPGTTTDLQVMMDVLDHIPDLQERFRLSDRIIHALEVQVGRPHFSSQLEEGLRRALKTTGQVAREQVRMAEAEDRFSRAVRLYRGQPQQPSLASRQEVHSRCWLEADLLEVQVSNGSHAQALGTARNIADICERFLTIAPWDFFVRAAVVNAYSAVLRSELRQSPMGEHASRFMSEFRWNSPFLFYYSASSIGTNEPTIEDINLPSWANSERSALEDLITVSQNAGVVVGPASGIAFARLARDMSRRQHLSFDCVANAAWSRANDELGSGVPANENELTVLYDRAQLWLNAGAAAIVTECTPEMHDS